MPHFSSLSPSFLLGVILPHREIQMKHLIPVTLNCNSAQAVKELTCCTQKHLCKLKADPACADSSVGDGMEA